MKLLSARTAVAVLALALGRMAMIPAAANTVPAHLDIGDLAPELHPAEWLKGKPISQFESNQVYVVEFWATWCGPCKANIPHLTALAKKYSGQVEIAGISIWEGTDTNDAGYLPKVENFVKHEGDQMDYHVAVDGPQGDIANSWMKAAGESGIPASFIVGRDRRIAWIGYPAKIDEALQQVLDGKFDATAAKRQRDHDLADVRPLKDAMDTKDYPRALQLIDAMIAKKPSSEPAYAYPRLVALFHVDVTGAIAWSNQLLTEQNHDIGIYRMVASILATQNDLTPAAYNYGQGLIDDALKKGEMGYLFLAMNADLRENLKDTAGAVKCQEQAVAAAEHDVHAPADFVESMRKKLVSLKAEL